MTSLNNLLRTTRISAGPKEKPAKSNPVIRDTSRAAGKQVKLKPIRKKPYMSEGSLSVPKIHSIDAPKSSLDVSSSNYDAYYNRVLESTALPTPIFVNAPAVDTYTPTSYQKELCELLIPSRDDESIGQQYNGPPFTISRGIKCSVKVDHVFLKAAALQIEKSYRVLSTEFFRNPKIYDADIECILRNKSCFLVEKSDIQVPSHAAEDEITSFLLVESDSFRRKVDISHPFGICQFESSDSSYLVFIGSNAVVDNVSLIFIANETMKIYSLLHSSNGQEAVYNCLETEGFVESTQNFPLRPNDIAFWKALLIEVTKEKLDHFEEKNLKNEIGRLESEITRIKISLGSLEKRKIEQEKTLKQLRRQRLELDINSENSEMEPKCTIFDSVTGDTIQISYKAKMALIKSVLGEEAASDNVTLLLEKHEISKDVQYRLNSKELTLEKFASLTEAEILKYNLLSKDRRQVLALADYAKNRLKECIYEQAKVKFNLERRISKESRDYDSTVKYYNELTTLVENYDDLSIRLKSIVNPPTVAQPIFPANFSLLRGKILNGDSINKYGLAPFRIEAETFESIRMFRSNWAASIRNKQKAKNRDEDNDILLDSDSEFEDFSKILDSSNRRYSRRFNTKSVDVVCLTAFAIFVKHVCGSDKCLIGNVTSFRYPGLLVGPLSDTLPIKVDISKNGVTFDQLYESLFKSIVNCTRYGSGCSSMLISKVSENAKDLKICFEYIDNAERLDWEQVGLALEDLLSDMHDHTLNNFSYKSMWSVEGQDDYDLKLIMVENADKIECRFKYRKDYFSDAKIERWIIKYQTTLDGIDPTRKIEVASIVSKYKILTLDIIRKYGVAVVTYWAAVAFILQSAAVFKMSPKNKKSLV